MNTAYIYLKGIYHYAACTYTYVNEAYYAAIYSNDGQFIENVDPRYSPESITSIVRKRLEELDKSVDTTRNDLNELKKYGWSYESPN